MLAMGSSVFRSRLHSTRPVDATAMAAALACTPTGPVVPARASLAGRVSLAVAAGTLTVSARPTARTTAPATARAPAWAPAPVQPGTRTVCRARAAIATPVAEPADNSGKPT